MSEVPRRHNGNRRRLPVRLVPVGLACAMLALSAVPSNAASNRRTVRTATTKPVTIKPASTVIAPTSEATIPMVTLASTNSGSSVTDRPGTLLASEPLKDAPAGGRAFKIRYRSTSVDGRPIEVTGLAFLPKGKAPAGGWPVLSYAHGTVGLSDKCTPSQNLSSIETTIASVFLAAGIAVVASDYEGLGTAGRHPYLVGVSEGRGVIDIVRAARNLPNAGLSNRFVTWGHSQGGHASLFAGELAASWAPDLKLLGVVAGAPPSQLTNVAESVQNSPFRGYLFMVAAGLHAADPSLELAQVLTPKAQSLLPVVDTGCNAAVFKAFGADPLNDLVIRDGLERDPWRSALLANEPGQRKTGAPILLIHGDKDEQIPVETSAVLKKKLCGLGNKVDRKVYKNQDHGGAALASLFEVVTWIGARTLDLPAKSTC